MRRKEIRSAIAWCLLFAMCFLLPSMVEAAVVDRPWGIYAEEGRG